MDTRDFSVDTIEEIYDIIEELKNQGTFLDSMGDFWIRGEPSAVMLCTYAANGEMEEYYRKYADSMNLTKEKFGKIVENVRAVDKKYQEKFTDAKEEMQDFQEKLKNLAQEISMRTISLSEGQYHRAVEVLEGEDNQKKRQLETLIGVTRGSSGSSRMEEKIKEILKYSVGNGNLEDELDVESTESGISQKRKMITKVEELKQQFKKGKITQDELISQICELYHVEDYGSKINYSLAVKKYQPEKKAAIVSDIFSTVLYIIGEDGIDAEKIEEIRQSVSAKSYIDDETWDMVEKAFRGVVVGVNAAVAADYYGNVGKVESGGKSVDTGSLKVVETRDPKIANDEWLERGYDRPPYNCDYEVKVVEAGNEEYVRVFSYNEEGKSNKLGGWLMRKRDIEGLTPKQIADKYALPKVPTHICDVNVNPDFNLQTGIANPVEEWGSGGGQQFDTMGKRLPKSAFVNERLIGE